MEYKLEQRSLSSSNLKKKPRKIKEIAQMARSTESRRQLLRNISMPTVINLKSKSLKKTELTFNASQSSLHKFKSTDNSGILNSSKKDLINFIRTQHAPLTIPGNLTLRLFEKPKLLKLERKNSRIDISNDSKTNTSRGRLSIRARPISKEKNNNYMTQSLISPSNIKEIKKSISKYSMRTKTGSVNGQLKKQNQDACFIRPEFANTPNQYLISVMDGHGIFGHRVSSFVKRALPLRIESYFPADCKCYIVQTKAMITKEDLNKIRCGFVEGFLRTAADLEQKRQIDVTYSGTTCISLLVRGDMLLCANVGDSRAIVGRFDGEKWTVIPLSRDHKPNDPLEKLRILKSGGRVEPYLEENGQFVGPFRVWLKHEQIPGLAMSRAIGDQVASSVGVIAEPEIIEHKLTSIDRFIIIGSDGIWEFLTNQDCVNMVAPYFQVDDIEGACIRLAEEAESAWKKHDDVIDDITVIIAFLHE